MAPSPASRTPIRPRSPARAGLIRRLSGYWRMEAGNAVLLPVVVVLVADSAGQPLGPATLIGWAGAVALLIAGAVYWRAKLGALAGRDPRPVLRLLARLRPGLLALSMIGAAAALAAWAGLGVSAADRWAATAGGVLGLLEYANYYLVQLQHFDRAADFLRLIRGRGFRRAHLARDIAALDR